MTVLTRRRTREGAFAPLTALLLIPLMAMLAFAIDMGWVVVVQSDLQSAADAAALAGSQPLMDGYVQYNLPKQTNSQQAAILSQTIANAKAAAKNYASYNSAGVASLTLNDGDIQVGYTDGSGSFSTNSGNFPNTVKVTVRRDSSANGSVGLFFGPVIGKSSQDLTATAAATIYEASANGFQNVSNFSLGMLPMTYDINEWNGFLKDGKNPDGQSQKDASGNAVLQIYPSVKDTGNFGLLSLDGTHVGSSVNQSWIASGVTQADVQSLNSLSMGDQVPLIPLSAHNAANNGTPILPINSNDGLGSWNWVGNPGVQTSDIHALDPYIGKTYLIPLFVPYDAGTGTGGKTNGNGNKGTTGYTAGYGGGSSYYYNIVQFVSVKIVSTTAADGSAGVVVQPSSMVLDYSQVTFGSTPVPAGSNSSTAGQATTFTPPKLSQ